MSPVIRRVDVIADAAGGVGDTCSPPRMEGPDTGAGSGAVGVVVVAGDGCASPVFRASALDLASKKTLDSKLTSSEPICSSYQKRSNVPSGF
jgi:hypothetical protein